MKDILSIRLRIEFETITGFLSFRYPESFTFKDCSELYDYQEYMEKIKEPVALDLIKERLHPGFDEQV